MSEGVRNEIVIVRRRSGDDDEGHHGGAWKIAFADFMTAMMAFFLVMWLINATNKKTQAEIAAYFNPMKLTDRVPNPRGLQEMERGGKQKSNAPDASEMLDGDAKEGVKQATAKKASTEEAMFRDPYGVLARLAAEGTIQNSAHKAESAASGESAGGEKSGQAEAMSDMFDPAQWRDESHQTTTEAENPKEAQQGEGAGEGFGPGEGPGAGEGEGPGAGPSTGPADGTAPAEATAQTDGDVADETKTGKGPDVAAQKAAAEALQKAEAEKARAAIEAEIKASFDAGAKDLPNVEVERTPEGILIRLTDAEPAGMFDIASAQPKPNVVTLIANVGKVLSSRKGSVVVAGHTDGRPFRDDRYDNWRLSSARAQMAYYMLVRGGLDEKRVERIDGHADRALRKPDDPGAAQNRRIEILLKDVKT